MAATLEDLPSYHATNAVDIGRTVGGATVQGSVTIR